MSVLDQSPAEHRNPDHAAATHAQAAAVSSAPEPPVNSPSASETTTEPFSTDSTNERNVIAESTFPDDTRNAAIHTSYEIGDRTCGGASSIEEEEEEGTIDAAVVEEIVEEALVAAPPLLPSRGENEWARHSSAEALPVQVATHMIPEVEPEVDIEEIHVVARQDASHISAVSALTTTSVLTTTSIEDAKLPPVPRYPSAAAPPPMMPPRQALDGRGVSAGTALTSAAVVMHSAAPEFALSPTILDLPDYKDQSRPRIPSGSPLSSRNASNNSGGSHQTGTNSSSPPSGRVYSSQRLGGTLEHQDHIPVVDAILVPAERLAEEEEQAQLRHASPPGGSSSEEGPRSSGHSSGTSTLSTSRTSSNPVSDGHGNSSSSNSANHDAADASRRSKGSDPAAAGRPISERRFWMTVIVAALLLNSLLVAGAVVGGFCAAGKCSRSSAALSGAAGGVPPGNTASSAPSPSPSRLLSAPSLVPSVATTFGSSYPPDQGDFVPQTPTRSPAPMGPLEVFTILPTVSPRPTVSPVPTLSPTRSPAPVFLKFSPTLESIAPAGMETTVASLFPSSTYVDDTVGREPSAADFLVSYAPSASPSANAGKNAAPEESATNESDGVSLAVLIPVLVGLEALIMAALLLYYRWWKRQKALYSSDYDAILAPETANTVESSPGAASSPSPLCHTSRSSTGSSGPAALPTIDECESQDHDQYSV